MNDSVKLYKVDKYNKDEQFIKKSFIEYTLDDAINELKNNKCYHMRLEKGKKYIFFGDCDNFSGTFLDFAILMKVFLNKYYNIKIKKKDISYTENKSKKGSFHYSIPHLHGINDKILKKIHENFSNVHKESLYVDETRKKSCIDTTIYTDKWFRMPNQRKEKKIGTEHIIIKGEMKDFIVNYIPENSINIDDKVFIQQNKSNNRNNKIIITDDYFSNDEFKNEKKVTTKKKTEDIAENNEIFIENKKIHFSDVKELINNLNIDRADIYNDWVDIGMALANISKEDKFLILWDEWSKNSDKYKEGECTKKWKGFTKKDKHKTVSTLLSMLKIDNKGKFIEICKRLNIKNIIMERKKHFPNNELEIDNIVSNSNSHYIQLADKYCPIIKGEHKKRCNYMEINKLGQLVLKCFCQDCRGKEFPQDSILMLSKNELGTIFNLTQNNYITINNNIVETNDPNEIYSEIIKLDSNAKIFEDSELNKLMLESLTGSDSTISQVLYYLQKNNFVCSKEKVWYEFKNHRWIESELITTYISDEFIKYYQKIILFINNSQILSKTDKNISIKEIKKIIKILQSKTRKANIIDELGVRLRINNPKFFDLLDTKPYLISFDNGVYDLNEMKFRNGKSEDMISMSCNYDFKPEYSQYKENLLTFLKEILPIDDDREYFLTHLSSCLTGLNISELFTILTGKGRNGKSKLIELIAFTMGDYIGRPKCKLLTGTRPDENSPEPGLLSLKKKRIIMVSEPEVGDKLNSGFIKFITGNDAEALRKCHKNEMELFKANFITFLVCNDIPD